jgi:hypothetical protein
MRHPGARWLACGCGYLGVDHDLDRFVFLLGGSDGEQFLTGDHDEPAEGGTNGN